MVETIATELLVAPAKAHCTGYQCHVKRRDLADLLWPLLSWLEKDLTTKDRREHERVRKRLRATAAVGRPTINPASSLASRGYLGI